MVRVGRATRGVPSSAVGCSESVEDAVRIVVRENGAGLSRDARFVRSLFESAGVPVATAVPQRRGSGSTCAANMFLETVATTHFSSARVNIVVPNPEWWRPSWTQTIRRADVVVFAKTRDTEDIFSKLGARVIHVGFTSDDRFRTVVSKQRRFLHVAGKSCLKGTIPVLELWARRPDLPLLTVVDRLRRHTRFAGHRNIRVIPRRLDDEELATLQNSHLLHICPSEYEGFGHTLWEALSCASVCITTGAGPMAEVVPPSGAFLVSPSNTGTKALATTQHVTADTLEAVVDDAVSRADDELIAMGATARRWWERNDRDARCAWLDAWETVSQERLSSSARQSRPASSTWTAPSELEALDAVSCVPVPLGALAGV